MFALRHDGLIAVYSL